MDASASSHADEMLALTLGDVYESEQRPHSKERTSVTSTAFESFASHDHTEHTGALSMPLTLAASPTILPLPSSLSLTAANTVSDSRTPLLRYMVLDRQGVTVSEQYFQTDTGVAGEFTAEMQKATDEYRCLTDAINLTEPSDTGPLTSRYVAAAHVDVVSTIEAASTGICPTRKRKQGANVSIDLQTKIRIIEVAEQYQYDPKSSGRSKHQHESGTVAGLNTGKDCVNGIRLAEQFGLNKSTVSRILKRKEEFKKAYYKDKISGCSKHINKKSKFDKLNRLVENWFDVHRAKNAPISDTLIRDVGKRFAKELGIKDFRGSNGWVRSLRNRKEHVARSSGKIGEEEAEQRKKDCEAIERMRTIFPNGVKDMAGFFKDFSTYLEKDGAGMGGFCASGAAARSSTDCSARDSAAALTGASYSVMDDANPRDDDGSVAEEFLKKRMIESLRIWSQELMTSELAKLKKRMNPRHATIL
ncbi:unnamed protein product [Hyaloperonospora brassicae]|uniref:HTH CENPB-type domain-containing protein n=1 Tax=Hyaloperonospora brassicae TaxID=162125 RepID=A0AAV0TVS4_HYABA|nr:unnamed protein product [Hyaloperonospora brassicae]